MRFILLICLLWSGLVHGALAGEGYIRGSVYDKQTGEPLPGATIIARRGLGTVSDIQGNYMVKVPEGQFNITFQYVGYQPQQHPVFITENDTVRLDVGLEFQVSEIDQVVVSASLIEQKLSELTVSLSLIKPEYLSGGHISDAQELINKSPGIEVLDGQASIRGGSGFSYGAGSRVLALIDGLPAMTADAGNIRWQFLPLDNISQIEIIKGASSVAYGSSALNGIINIRTADAGVEPVTRFYLETGIFDQPANREWKWWDTPRIFTSTSASHLQRFGNTDLGVGLHLLSDGGYRHLNDEQLGRMNLKLKHRSSLHEGLVYGINLNGGATRKTDFLLWENANAGALKNNHETAIQLNSHFFALDPYISYHKGERFKHELRSRVQSSKNEFPESGQNNSRSVSIYAAYHFWNRLSDRVTLNTGISENFSRINSQFYGDHTYFNAGAFAQFELSPGDRWRIVSGVRVEFNSLDGEQDALVPLVRAGANYRVADYTFLRASFGQGYRYPSIAEKHAATTLGAIQIYPNLFVEAEKGWNTEVGIKQGISVGSFQGQLDGALFYSENKQMIEYVFGIYPNPDGTFGFGFRADNTEASRVYGLELEYVLSKTTGKISHFINGGYVFMYPVEMNAYTRRNSENMLKYRRKHSASANWTSSYRKFDFGASLFYKSRMLRIDDVFLADLTGEQLLPGFIRYWNENNTGYFHADLQTGYRLTNQYKLSLVVKNITNTEYMGRPGDIQPHRNYSLRFSGRF